MKKEHYNLSSKSEGQKQDEAYDKYSSISQLDAIFKSKQIQGITTKEQEKVEGLDSIKLEQAQSINKKDGNKCRWTNYSDYLKFKNAQLIVQDIDGTHQSLTGNSNNINL